MEAAMSIFQRWKLHSRLKTIRADVDRISQRIDHTETRVGQFSTRLDSISSASKRLSDNK